MFGTPLPKAIKKQISEFKDKNLYFKKMKKEVKNKKSLIFNCYFTTHLIRHYQTISSRHCYHAISRLFQPLDVLSAVRKIR